MCAAGNDSELERGGYPTVLNRGCRIDALDERRRGGLEI